MTEMLHGVFRPCAHKNLLQSGGCFFSDCLIDPEKFVESVFLFVCVSSVRFFFFYITNHLLEWSKEESSQNSKATLSLPGFFNRSLENPSLSPASYLSFSFFLPVCFSLPFRTTPSATEA